MTQSPDAVRLARTLTDLWYPDVDPERDYPRVVVTLGDGRTARLLEVGYETDSNALVLHVEDDVTDDDEEDVTVLDDPPPPPLDRSRWDPSVEACYPDGPPRDRLADVVAALLDLDAVVAEAVARDEADDAPAYHTARAVRSWRDALLRRLTEEDT